MKHTATHDPDNCLTCRLIRIGAKLVKIALADCAPLRAAAFADPALPLHFFVPAESIDDWQGDMSWDTTVEDADIWLVCTYDDGDPDAPCVLINTTLGECRERFPELFPPEEGAPRP